MPAFSLWEEVMHKSYLFIVLCFVFSCGSVGENSGATPPVVISPAGLWEGSMTSDITNITYDIIGIISEDYEMILISGIRAGYHGNITMDGNEGSGDFTAYAPPGFLFGDGSAVTSGTFSFTCDEKVSISGTYTSPGDSGSFSLTYDDSAEVDTTMSDVAGDWGYQNNANSWENISIDISGSLTGSMSSGCNYAGNIDIIDSRWSIFQINYTMSDCGALDGEYSGLAVIDHTTQPKTLIYMVSSPEAAFISVLDRQ